MFDKILIANRGEIACRIARTAKRVGIKTVAVYSQSDCHARHVRECSEAFFIGEAAALESYLCVPRIIDACKKSGAEAVHPGYGFLSENADFAETCARNDLTFIGAGADAIRAMGEKSRAKELMIDAGVPVVAGYHGTGQGAKTLQSAADEIGYPLLIKAVAGGGGKGMRVVERADEFAESLASVKRESAASFADDRVLLEKYLPTARHVEVQIFTDQHGHAVHLFERDCSIQRRHQKIIEEAPAAGISAQLRKKMGAAAVDAAKAIDYIGAGTVEFLLDAKMRFYFMEMNTRLQVEHPVTEMITGQDLVEWQLRVAAGEPLPCGQSDLRINGHAMEARIYAENPDNNFLPAIGTLAVYRHAPQHAHLRIDSGVNEGDEISPHYDPMIAKLIAWGEDRESARKRLRHALAGFDIAGVTTNLNFLHAVSGLDDFITPALDTALIERNRQTLFADSGQPSETFLLIATLFESLSITSNEKKIPGEHDDPFSPWSPPLPWSPMPPWQLNLPVEATCVFIGACGELEYTIRFEQGQAFARIDGERLPISLTPLTPPTPLTDIHFHFHHGKRTQLVSVVKIANTIYINIDGYRRALTVAKHAGGLMRDTAEDGEDADHAAALRAPMPGIVVAVVVEENQQVKRGAALLTLEAMKMEHTITAPHAGRVMKIFFRQGEQVREGDQLLELEAREE